MGLGVSRDENAERSRCVIKDWRDTLVPAECVANFVELGDVVLFSGATSISLLIRYSTYSRWSHMGMVDKRTLNDDSGGVEEVCSLWESLRNQDGNMDQLTQSQQKTGVRLVDLVQRLRSFVLQHGSAADKEAKQLCAEIGVLKLQLPDGMRQDAAKRLSQFQADEHRKAFEQNKLAMIRAQYEDFLGTNQPDTSSYFCSELVVQTYLAMGLFTQPVNSSRYTPATIADYPNALPWKEGCALGPELHLYRIAVEKPPEE